jgi:hypothetical protein
MKTTAHHSARRRTAAARGTRPTETETETPSPAALPERCWTALLEAGPDGTPCIREGGTLRPVRAAAGCLLVPMAGDTVLCFGAATGERWVLSVLERGAGARERVLRCEGDTRLVVEGGRLALEAERLQLGADHLALRAKTAAVSLDTTEFVGERVRMVASTFKLVGSVLSTVMDRVNHFSQHYLRTTKGLDRVHAAHIERDASELLHLRGEHALINGAKLVKTRGAQIHFG